MEYLKVNAEAVLVFDFEAVPGPEGWGWVRLSKLTELSRIAGAGLPHGEIWEAETGFELAHRHSACARKHREVLLLNNQVVEAWPDEIGEDDDTQACYQPVIPLSYGTEDSVIIYPTWATTSAEGRRELDDEFYLPAGYAEAIRETIAAGIWGSEVEQGEHDYNCGRHVDRNECHVQMSIQPDGTVKPELAWHDRGDLAPRRGFR